MDLSRPASASASTRRHLISSRASQPANGAEALPVRLPVDQSLLTGHAIGPGENDVR
jgi:hypothetical protein